MTIRPRALRLPRRIRPLAPRRVCRALIAAWATPFALLVPGCGGGAPFEDLVMLEPPVGPGSGMPHLEADGNTVLMSWLEPSRPGGDVFRLRVATYLGGEWSAPRTYAAGDDFFVNWADFPSALTVSTGETVAHWLERGGRARYDYDVVLTSDLPGGSQSLAWRPHQDGTPTEHGFVSMVAGANGDLGVAWLDGRKYQEARESGGEEEMALRWRDAVPDGPIGPEVVLDGRTCDCCQTDAAVTGEGVAVVYRDRSPDEIRDIAIVRRPHGSAWTEPTLVHADGWEIASCPVNGPAIAAEDAIVAVAWFTAAQDDPRVLVAFSSDAGATFDAPVRVDAGRPIGRVDVVLTEAGDALVSWIEQLAGDSAELRVRRVDRAGRPRGTGTVVRTSAARASGFPQMVRAGPRLVVAWKDLEDDRVHLASATLPR